MIYKRIPGLFHTLIKCWQYMLTERESRLTREASMFLIHLMAWPWGSTIRGHRLDEVTMTPFSVEKASLGNPWMFQSLTWVGLAMNSQKLKFGAQGIPSLRTCQLQQFYHCKMQNIGQAGSSKINKTRLHLPQSSINASNCNLHMKTIIINKHLTQNF